jgi:AcrR family transcriptional regulator
MVEMIMRAATRILIRDGYEALNTNLVAEEAGASVGSLYQYFSSKQQLVAAVLERHIDQTLHDVRVEMPQIMSMPVPKAVRRFITLMIESHRIEPELHRVFVEQLPRIGDFKKVEASLNEGMTLATAYLQMHEHEITPRNHALSAFMLVNTVETLTHAAVLTRPDLLGSDELIDELTDMLVRYLVPH